MELYNCQTTVYGFRDKKELVEHGAEHMVEDGYALLHVLEDAFELG